MPDYFLGFTFFEWVRLEMTFAAAVAIAGMLIAGHLYIGVSRGPFIILGIANLALFATKACFYAIVLWFYRSDALLNRIALQLVPWTIVLQVAITCAVTFRAAGGFRRGRTP